MAYSEFTLDKAIHDFDLIVDQRTVLFENIPEIPVSERLQSLLEEYTPLALAINTEKARSEMIMTPILIELRRLMDRQISLFSGIDFKVAPTEGLNGYCDYIISQSSMQLYLDAPLLMVVEAKKEDIIAGLGQCAAEMVAARIYNKRADKEISPVYGAVTSGNNWKFLTLQGTLLTIDLTEYYLEPPGKLLGILLHIVQSAKQREKGKL